MTSAIPGFAYSKRRRRRAIEWPMPAKIYNCCALSRSRLVFDFDIDVAERYRTVIALQHDGVRGGFRNFHVAYGRFRTSTFCWITSPFKITRNIFALEIFFPEASKRGAENQM